MGRYDSEYITVAGNHATHKRVFKIIKITTETVETEGRRRHLRCHHCRRRRHCRARTPGGTA